MKFPGLNLLILIAAIVGVYISYGLLEEDILSTAATLYTYFPAQFNVTPTTTQEGSLWLGRFVTVVQIIASAVAFNKKFTLPFRAMAGAALLLATPFDIWTDMVHRSAWLQGNVAVSLVVTLTFYTFGSEIVQGLSWMVIFSTWRAAISDLLWGTIRLFDGIGSIGVEVQRFQSASRRREMREVDERTGASQPQQPRGPDPRQRR